MDDIEDIDKKIGFSRPLTDCSKGTIDFYQRHLFVCAGIDAAQWPSSAEKLTEPPLVSEVFQAIKKAKEAFPKKTYSNLVDIKPEGEGVDVLIFPESIKFTGVTSETLATFIEDLKRNDSNFTSPHTSITGSWVGVCAHNAKDTRCGYCGPKLIEEIQKRIDKEKLNMHVFATSHVGGHKFAGNLLIFPPGDWYGSVCPKDVDDVIQHHIRGDTLYRLWRGRLGLEKGEVQSLIGVTPPQPTATPPPVSLPTSTSPTTAHAPPSPSRGLYTNGPGQPGIGMPPHRRWYCNMPLAVAVIGVGMAFTYYRYRNQK